MSLYPVKKTPLAIALLTALGSVSAVADDFAADNLLITRSFYTGDASSVTIGQALPGGGIAVANGSYPNVFQNETPDPSFGITSPIIVDQVTRSGTLVSSTNITAQAKALGYDLTSSFPSKSEIAINRSTNGSSVSFMGYIAPVNTLDVSNSNTPGHIDPTNPVASTYQRAVAQMDVHGNLQITPVNAYSGNNGRAVILDNAHNQYFMVGNAGNGSGTPPTNIVNNTGVQIATPGGNANTTVVGQQQGTPGAAKGFQYGFSVTQAGQVADKSGKDNNFRGLTVGPDGNVYVSKGSGGNGVNTVYKVSANGNAPTAATAAATTIEILPGFSTTPASSTTSPVAHPFGLFFPDAKTLYVADEGDGKAADATTDANSGLQKWSNIGGVWTLDYVLKAGLNLGQQYGVAGLDSALNPATDGLRNIAGKVNADGSVSIYAVTSTVSAATDQGADANKIVFINDMLSFTNGSQAINEQFQTLRDAQYANVYRGVALTPTDVAAVPIPATLPLFASSLLAMFGIARKRRMQ